MPQADRREQANRIAAMHHEAQANEWLKMMVMAKVEFRLDNDGLHLYNGDRHIVLKERKDASTD